MPARIMVLALALCAAAVLPACDSGVAVAPQDGVNRAPNISKAVIHETADGALDISAVVNDPEGDAVSVQIDQREGPTATQRFVDFDDVNFEAMFDCTGDGMHTFRIRAFDGRSSSAAFVSIMIGDGEPPATLPLPIYDAPVYQNAQYNIRITGQVPADAGFTSFALNGSLNLQGTTFDRTDDRIPVPALNISTVPLTTLAPPGAMTFDTTTLKRNDLDVTFVGRNFVVLTGRTYVGVLSPGRFVPDQTPPGPVDVVVFEIVLEFNGDQVTGSVLLSSFPQPVDTLRIAPEFDGVLTGNRN